MENEFNKKKVIKIYNREWKVGGKVGRIMRNGINPKKSEREFGHTGKDSGVPSRNGPHFGVLIRFKYHNSAPHLQLRKRRYPMQGEKKKGIKD